MTLTLQRLDLDECDWNAMDAFPDRVVFQTPEWLAFLNTAFGAEPVVCAILDGGVQIGFFTGLITRRFGIRILGSPLPGWTTSYMGFNLAEGISRREALLALLAYSHDELGCGHVEVRDRLLSEASSAKPRIKREWFDTLEVDLQPDEDELFSRMNSACRRCIRKAEKMNVTVEEASDLAFADDYYTQLKDVFAKQGLSPTYDIEVVRALVEQVHPSGHLLLLRALSPEGECIATGIYPALNKTAYFWGGASWRSSQILRPNETLFWHAMRYWKRKGITAMDLGAGEYKRKYGVRDVAVPHFVHSSFPGLGALRSLLKVVHTSERLRRFARAASGARHTG